MSPGASTAGPAPVVIAPLCADEATAEIEALAALLHDCVQAGASIGFVLPFARDEAAGYWRAEVLPRLAAGGLDLLVARADGRLVGSVLLACATPANQPHRAEARKLLVHPRWRRRGIGRALMAALERAARARGRSLVTLDTRSGDAAEPLYAGLGYAVAGVIPGYCCDPFDPRRLDATTIMYKTL